MIGQWKHDKFDGWGCLKHLNGSTYEGGFKDGLRSGMVCGLRLILIVSRWINIWVDGLIKLLLYGLFRQIICIHDLIKRLAI